MEATLTYTHRYGLDYFEEFKYKVDVDKYDVEEFLGREVTDDDDDVEMYLRNPDFVDWLREKHRRDADHAYDGR